MCKRIMVVVMLAVVMAVVVLSGCVELGLKSQIHFATQAPKVVIDKQAKKYAWDYAPPLKSKEVVNAEPVQQSAQPKVIVVPNAQNREQQTPVSRYSQLVTWGNLEGK